MKAGGKGGGGGVAAEAKWNQPGTMTVSEAGINKIKHSLWKVGESPKPQRSAPPQASGLMRSPLCGPACVSGHTLTHHWLTDCKKNTLLVKPSPITHSRHCCLQRFANRFWWCFREDVENCKSSIVRGNWKPPRKVQSHSSREMNFLVNTEPFF